MTLENGTLILADYTAKVKDTGQIIDTTRKEDAEKAGNADPTRTYEPRLIAVGDGWMLKGVDEALLKANPNQTLDIELTPEKAFGVRDPNRVSRIPIKKFGEKAAELEVGEEIEVDNRVGIVRAIESGRVLIDFNHRYAGKTLQYNLEIKQKLEERNQQIEALIRRRLPIEKEKVKFESIGESEVKVTIPNDYFLLDGLQIIKRGISTDLFKYIKPLDKVSFVEEYENPAKKEAEPKKQEEEKKEATPAEQPKETAPAEQTTPASETKV
jgi:FKBP-type peptidyl-prolyl cis-trans isomerase 2